LSPDADLHEAYFQSLPREEVQLLYLQVVLYENSWEEMVKDLMARREGKPFVFKLRSRIDEDLQRIEKLRAYERQHGVNLGEFVRRAHPGVT
jgi:hypothetical protein